MKVMSRSYNLQNAPFTFGCRILLGISNPAAEAYQQTDRQRTAILETSGTCHNMLKSFIVNERLML